MNFSYKYFYYEKHYGIQSEIRVINTPQDFKQMKIWTTVMTWRTTHLMFRHAASKWFQMQTNASFSGNTRVSLCSITFFFYWSKILFLTWSKYFSLSPESIVYLGDKSVFRYTLLDIYMCTARVKSGENIEITFRFGRNLLSSLMTDFIPTIVCNIIAYCTNFFPKENFDSAIGVNLTVLLVIVTMWV